MALEKSSNILQIFEAKIQDAVNLIPEMCPTERAKAILFWNFFSEKLQVFVNRSVIDIPTVSTVSLKKREEARKVPLEVDILESTTTVSECSDNLNLNSNFGIDPEPSEQCQSATDTDENLKEMLPPESIPSESSMDSLSHLNPVSGFLEKSASSQQNPIEQFSSGNHDTSSVNSSDVAAIAQDIFSVSLLKNNNSSINGSTTLKPFILRLTSDESRDVDLEPKAAQSSDKSCKSSTTKSVFVDKKFAEVSKESCDKLNLSQKVTLKNQSQNSGLNFGVNFLPKQTLNSREEILNFIVSDSPGTVLNKGEIIEKNLSTASSEVNSKKLNSDDDLGHSKEFKCTECNSQFSTKGNLTVHMRRHTGERPFVCKKCKATFSTKQNMKRHYKTHSGRKPYKCNLCGGRFTEKKSLKVHMRRHTGEKPYKCRICGRCFAQTGILQNHMAMHLDQRFHLCEQCGKAFRQKSQLHIHQKRHENVKNYSCPHCSASFVFKADLDRHIRSHTGERPFKCTKCSGSFTRQQTLKEHMNRHLGIRAYYCKYCSRAFYEMSACAKHVKTHEKSLEENEKNKGNGQSESSRDQDNEMGPDDIYNSLKVEMIEIDKEYTPDEPVTPMDMLS